VRESSLLSKQSQTSSFPETSKAALCQNPYVFVIGEYDRYWRADKKQKEFLALPLTLFKAMTISGVP